MAPPPPPGRRKSMAQGISGWLGVNEDISAKHAERWENRRMRFAESIGHVKEEYRRASQAGQCEGAKYEKSSILHMGAKGAANVLGFRRKQDTEAAILTAHQAQLKAETGEKRVVGVGVMGRFLRPSIHVQAFTRDVKTQLDEMDDYRPFFTYWATFVQIVIFLLAVSIYGSAPFGVGDFEEERQVRLSNLAREVKRYKESRNIWLGPRQKDLIHLGAKYSPCMRKDMNLRQALNYDRLEEQKSACCVRNDGSGCVQRNKDHCDALSSWKKWDAASQGPDGRESGTVCGQDPQYCTDPPSTGTGKWKDDITEWPVCKTTNKPNQTVGSKVDRHMSCEILGHPCCHGIQGECFITTLEHCDLLRGKFHPDQFLCAQTNCIKEICGMIPFANPNTPDQFYRLWTSIFLHGGLLHLMVTVFFQMWIMRDMEKLIGAIRMSIIYLGSGIAGNLASCTFIPYSVETGPSGAQFGVLACLLVEMLQSYQMYRRPMLALCKLVMPIIILFIFGMLPWFDNWAHIFGFFYGFLLAFALMPYVSFGHFDRGRKILTLVVCLGGSVLLFMILVLIFYTSKIRECDFCVYINCIPFTHDLCDGHTITLKNRSTYTDFY